MWMGLCTRHGFQQLGVTHLSLPDVSQCILHPLGPPQEVKDAEVVAHALSRKHLTHVTNGILIVFTRVMNGLVYEALPLRWVRRRGNPD